MNGRKEIGKLLREVKRQGCTVEVRGSGHYRITRGDRYITYSASPSCPHAMRHVRKDLREYLDLDI